MSTYRVVQGEGPTDAEGGVVKLRCGNLADAKKYARAYAKRLTYVDVVSVYREEAKPGEFTMVLRSWGEPVNADAARLERSLR